MRCIVRVDIPVISDEEIVEPVTDCHVVFGGDEREQTASENDDVGVWYPKDCTVEQDKVPERGVAANFSLKSKKNLESLRPI
jgi:hypothetical protein